MATFKTLILFPFRIFSHGDSAVHSIRKNQPLGQVAVNDTGGHQVRMSRYKSLKKNVDKLAGAKKLGFKEADTLSSIMAFLITTTLFLWAIAFIEDTPIFQKTYGHFNFSSRFEIIGLGIPEGARWIFYQDVLSKAMCSSEIALFQVAIFYIVFFSGIRLLLISLGSKSTGSQMPPVHRISSIMSFAIICLPAFGILSTVIGILSSDFISREEAKVLIFGPSGIGIIGFLVANFFNSMADYISAE